MSYNPYRDEMFEQISQEVARLTLTINSIQNFLDNEGKNYIPDYIEEITKLRDRTLKLKDRFNKLLNQYE